jgi:hypothetical protein
MRGIRGDDRQPIRCSVACRPSSGCRKITRCAPFARWWRTCCARCRASSTWYARLGRPSERLLWAQLLHIVYSIRTERLLIEQLHYNLLFRGFAGMEIDEPIWDATVFTKNRDPLLNQDIARGLFRHVVEGAKDLMSDEHSTVDGTLIDARASPKSFQGKDGGTDWDRRNLRRQERKNATHASTTDPDARVYRRSNQAESRLAYLGHLLIDNRRWFIVDEMATIADGFAQREASTLIVHEQ